MAETLQSAASLLSDQAKRYDIALYYTHVDDLKARQMVAGNYSDIYAVKARFSSSSVYGAFLIFFNHVYNSTSGVYAVVTQSFAVEDIKTSIDWKQFEDEIARITAMSEHDDILSAQMRDEVISYFSIHIGSGEQANELKKYIHADDPITVNRIMQKFIQNRFGLKNVNVSVDSEAISSVDMELMSSSSNKISDIEMKKMKDDEQKRKEPQIETISEDADEELKGKEIKLMMHGAFVLSPIKGKDIGLLTQGDRIKISILDTSRKAITVLKAFNAYSDGTPTPISGRIVSVKHKSAGGYKVFAVVAKGIYVKIDEEEGNIKVAVDNRGTGGAAIDEHASSRVSIPMIIVLVVIFIALVATVLAFVL